MPLILMCDICRQSYRASDLSTVRVDPPHYQDLPEPSADNYVDQNDRGDRFIYLHYCELCLDDLELPPVKPESDPSIAPDPYDLGDDMRTDGGNLYGIDDPGVPNEEGESWQDVVDRRQGDSEYCPGCGAEGNLEKTLAPGQRRCPTDHCAVVTFMDGGDE